MSISGCASTQYSRQQQANKPTLREVYLNSSADELRTEEYLNNLQTTENTGMVRPYVPILQQPTVKKIWIPAHPSEEDHNTLIGGHWIYLKIKEDEWYINQEQGNDRIRIPVIVPTSPRERRE